MVRNSLIKQPIIMKICTHMIQTPNQYIPIFVLFYLAILEIFEFCQTEIQIQIQTSEKIDQV